MATIGYPWRMLNTVRTITTGQRQEFRDLFNTGTTLDETNWSHPAWTLAGVLSSGMPTVADGLALNIAGNIPDLRTAVLETQAVSVESSRTVALSNWSGPLTPGPSVVYLMMDMASASPDPTTGGIYVEAAISSVSSTMTLYVDGVEVASWYHAGPLPGSVYSTVLAVDAANVVHVYWSSPTVPDINYSLGTYTATGDRVGFGLRSLLTGQIVSANAFTLLYFSASGSLPAVAMVGSNNGTIYYESTNGNMIQVNSSLTTLTDEWISAANRLHQLYIADHGVRYTNMAGTGAMSVSGTTLTDAGATFQTDLVDAQDDMVEIIGGTNATLGTYPIASITSETVLVVTGNMGTSSNATFRIMRAPKVFDSEDLSLTRMTASAGYVPPDCDIVAVYGDRLYLAGDGNVPEALYASKIGDPTNWDYGTNLPDEAFVYDPARVAGAPYIGDSITALIPHLDDYLIIGGTRSIWIQRGDPALGAPPEAISREIGILKQSAWCYTPDNTIVAMTLDGLYVIEPSPQSTPVRLSRDRMPQELVNINMNFNDVLVEYDTLRNGINIFVTPRNEAPTRHFWFGWQMKEFSPESYRPDFEPTAIVSHSLSAIGPRRVILGCRDGYLRVHENSAHTDDGENFDSRVLIGPIMLGGNGYYEGMIREVVGQLAADSGAVTMKIRTGDSVESAFNAMSRVSYVMRAGKNRTWRPNLRGNACFIELSSEGGEAWAFEQLSIVRERLGKQRLLA